MVQCRKFRSTPNTAVEYIGLTKLQIWRLTLQTYTKQDRRRSTAVFQSNLTPTLQTDRTQVMFTLYRIVAFAPVRKSYGIQGFCSRIRRVVARDFSDGAMLHPAAPISKVERLISDGICSIPWCSVNARTQPVREVNKQERGLEPTEKEKNIQE